VALRVNQPRQIIAPRPTKSMKIQHRKSLCGTTRFRKHPQNRVLDGARAILPSPTVEDGLERTRVSDLRPLSGLPRMTKLFLTDTRVSDLTPIQGLTDLQALDFSGTRVVDLRPLARLTNLRFLWFERTSVSDLRPLADLTAVTSLGMAETRVSDLRPLSGMARLQVLHLYGTPVSDLAPLASLKALQRLDLGGTRVVRLEPLAALTGLRELDLSQTHVCDLGPLKGLTGLRWLNLSHTQVMDLSPLRNLPNLESVLIDGTPVAASMMESGRPLARRSQRMAGAVCLTMSKRLPQKAAISARLRPDSWCMRNWSPSVPRTSRMNFASAACVYATRFFSVTPQGMPGEGWRSARSPTPPLWTPPR